MKHIARVFAGLLILCLAVPAAFALGGKETAAPVTAPLEPMTVRVGALKGPTGIGMIRLFETPPVLPQSVTAVFEAVASADAMAAKLLSGDLQAAVLPVNLAAKLYNSGMAYPVVAVVGNGMVRLVTTDPALVDVQGLRGRDLYVAGQGATPEYLIRTILKREGIDAEADLKLIFNMPYPEIAASLVAGRIQSALLPEPFATMALMGNPAARVAFPVGELWTRATGQADYPMSVFVMSASFIAERPEAAAALAASYRASIEAVKADPAAAGLLVEKHDMGLKAGVATKAIPVSNYVFVPAPAARPAIEALLSVFLAAVPASVGGKLPDDGFYATIAR